MASADAPEISLRLESRAYKRLGYALAISAGVHLLVFLLSLAAGNGKLSWLNHFVPKWLKPEAMLAEAVKKQQPKPPEPDAPIMFVDVNPEAAVTEAPKKTPYYSDKNSRAANPDPSIDTDAPKVDGKKAEIVKTEDVPKTKTFPLAPSVPKKEVEEQPETRAKPKYTPGDLVMARPDDKPKDSPGKEQQDRPRTLKEALLRNKQLNNRLAGEKMKQDGGVKRRSVMSSLDVTATEFGAYDAAIIAAVQNRWYDLLENRQYAGEQTGKVTLKFRLNVDGSVSEVSFMDSTVDLALGMLCQSAVKDPAPYAPWPSDMRRKIGEPFREVTFTFYYN